jgi:hypothetical protein
MYKPDEKIRSYLTIQTNVFFSMVKQKLLRYKMLPKKKNKKPPFHRTAMQSAFVFPGKKGRRGRKTMRAKHTFGSLSLLEQT